MIKVNSQKCGFASSNNTTGVHSRAHFFLHEKFGISKVFLITSLCSVSFHHSASPPHINEMKKSKAAALCLRRKSSTACYGFTRDALPIKCSYDPFTYGAEGDGGGGKRLRSELLTAIMKIYTVYSWKTIIHS